MARMVQMGRGVWPNARPLIRRSVSPASDPGFLLNVGSLYCTVYPWRKAQAISRTTRMTPKKTANYELLHLALPPVNFCAGFIPSL